MKSGEEYKVVYVDCGAQVVNSVCFCVIKKNNYEIKFMMTRKKKYDMNDDPKKKFLNDCVFILFIVFL